MEMMLKRALPETLPEIPAVDGSESRRPAFGGSADEDRSGMQPLAEAWDDVYARMWQAFKARDYGRAVDLGTRFVAGHPEHSASKLFVDECRTLLAAQLEKRLDPLDRVVVACVSLDSLVSARIDPRTAFLLSQVDGRTTIEDLVDLAPMPRAEALRIIAASIDGGLIEVG